MEGLALLPKRLRSSSQAGKAFSSADGSLVRQGSAAVSSGTHKGLGTFQETRFKWPVLAFEYPPEHQRIP